MFCPCNFCGRCSAAYKTSLRFERLRDHEYECQVYVCVDIGIGVCACIGIGICAHIGVGVCRLCKLIDLSLVSIGLLEPTLSYSS